MKGAGGGHRTLAFSRPCYTACGDDHHSFVPSFLISIINLGLSKTMEGAPERPHGELLEFPRRYSREQAWALNDEEFARLHELVDGITSEAITKSDPRYREWIDLDTKVHGQH